MPTSICSICRRWVFLLPVSIVRVSSSWVLICMLSLYNTENWDCRHLYSVVSTITLSGSIDSWQHSTQYNTENWDCRHLYSVVSTITLSGSIDSWQHSTQYNTENWHCRHLYSVVSTITLSGSCDVVGILRTSSFRYYWVSLAAVCPFSHVCVIVIFATKLSICLV